MENKIQDNSPDYLDLTLSLKDRKLAFKAKNELMMNPIHAKDFDPDNFEPLATAAEKEVADRVRAIPPKQLPTYGIKPKPIREGQMVGMFESKQDIYLTFAHRCNEMQVEIDLLKEEIKRLKQ
jgi:hypothetical protein